MGYGLIIWTAPWGCAALLPNEHIEMKRVCRKKLTRCYTRFCWKLWSCWFLWKWAWWDKKRPGLPRNKLVGGGKRAGHDSWEAQRAWSGKWMSTNAPGTCACRKGGCVVEFPWKKTILLLNPWACVMVMSSLRLPGDSFNLTCWFFFYFQHNLTGERNCTLVTFLNTGYIDLYKPEKGVPALGGFYLFYFKL